SIARTGEGADRETPIEPWFDDPLRDSRSDGGDDFGRQDRCHAIGNAAAGGHPDGTVRGPVQPVRCRILWVAFDELFSWNGDRQRNRPHVPGAFLGSRARGGQSGRSTSLFAAAEECSWNVR